MSASRFRAVLGHVVLAVGVFLGGAAMTAAWIALYFTGAQEPPAAAAPPDPTPVRAPGKRLLWLVFDAMRTDAAFDAELMPELAKLRRAGTWGVARTGTFTMTGTCVRALGTGMQPRPTHVIHNFRSPPIEADNLFRRIHRAGRKIVLVGDHIWTDLYRMTVRQTYPQPDLGIEDVHRSDRAAYRDAWATLPKGWDLALLHVVGSDHAAHKERGVRGLYRRKLAEYDAWIPKLRRRMGPDTTILVTADHACNEVGNHGAGEPEATRAPYVLAGPGIRALGRRDVDQRDIAPTVTALLGAPAPWGAERPGLLDALDVSPRQRATLAYNHAFQRVAHLRRLLGRDPSRLSARMARATLACQGGDVPRCRRESEAVIHAATRERIRLETAPWYVWGAALALLLGVPWLLLGGRQRTGRSWVVEGISLAALAAGTVALFVLPSRYGATVASAVILATAGGRWFAAGGWAPLGRGQLVCALLFGVAFAGGGTVEVLVRSVRGDPLGRLWLSPVILGILALCAGLAWRRLDLGVWLRQRPGPLVAWLAALLFLPLPALRWWGGRHVLFASLGVAVLLGCLAVVWRRGLLTARFGAGVGLGVGLLILGHVTTLGAARGAPQDALAWAIALATPALYAVLGGTRSRTPWWCVGLAVAAWGAAHVSRLTGIDQSSWILLGILGVAATLAARGGGGRVLHMLLWAAVFRLLAGDQALAAVALFGGALLGLTRIAWRPSRPMALLAVAVVMALLELALFYLLEREFAFGTIDVTVGFVGGGGLDLVRITALVVVSYAVPWWMLWTAVAAYQAPGEAVLDQLLRLHLWILAVKVLGTFLLFLGRPAHFWLIHSLIPFQFFSLCWVLMVLTGYLWARGLVRRVGAGAG